MTSLELAASSSGTRREDFFDRFIGAAQSNLHQYAHFPSHSDIQVLKNSNVQNGLKVGI
jgi:hypothetical protein